MIIQNQKVVMFEEIKKLVKECRTKRENGKGKLIEELKQITYFKNQYEIYGGDILFNYLPLLEPYILRKGMQTINNNDMYIIVEGSVKCIIKDIVLLADIYKEGMQVQIPSDKIGIIQALTDSKLLHITRSHPNKIKLWNSLCKMEKQRIAKGRQDKKTIDRCSGLTECRELMRKVDIFSKLGAYDLNEIVAFSKYTILEQGAVTHKAGTPVGHLIYVLTGRVKITHEEKSSGEFVGTKHNTSKYFVHEKKSNNQRFISHLQKGDFIGLEEYLWGSEFQSNGEVLSRDSKLVFIPEHIFKSKFNEISNYGIMHRLINLTATKKNIKDRSILTKKQKEFEMISQINSNILKEKLMKVHEGSTKNFHLQKQLKKRRQPIVPRECYMPERLIHKVQVFEAKYSSLPKIRDRVNLFPQQYNSIPFHLKQKINYNKKNDHNNERKRSLSPSSSNQTKVYERILETIGSIESKPEKKENNKTREDYLSPPTKYHFNQSIFNNFRTTRGAQENRLIPTFTRTLEIN